MMNAFPLFFVPGGQPSEWTKFSRIFWKSMIDAMFPSATNEAGRENKALERRNELQMLLFQRYEQRHHIAIDTSSVRETRSTNELFIEWCAAFSVRFASRLAEHPEWLTRPLDDDLVEEVEQLLYPSH